MPFRVCGYCKEAVLIGERCKCQPTEEKTKEKIKPKKKQQPPHIRHFKPVKKQSEPTKNKKQSESAKYLKKFGVSILKEIIKH